MNLKRKTMAALIWSFISQGGKQICQFGIMVILARRLSPNDFGLIGMATVFTGFVTIFNDLGIGNALVQKKDTDDRHLSSAFWLNLLVGFGLAGVFNLLSPSIAAFYEREELIPVLRVMSLNFIFASLTIVQQSILTKELNFRSLMVRDISAVAVSGAFGIYLAYRGYGVWSLVYQQLLFTLLNGVLLWFLSRWKPKLVFSVSAIREIAHFSRYMTGFNLVNYISRNIDYMLIGKFFGSEALGYYTLAYKLMLFPINNISWAMGKVMMPAFSMVQDDLERVRRNFKKFVRAISLAVFPIMAGLFSIADIFVNSVYGLKWSPAIDLIKIFCICGAVQALTNSVQHIYTSQGKVKLQFWMQIVSTVLASICIVLGMKWGVQGIAIWYTVQSVLWMTISIIVVDNLIGLKNSILFPSMIKPLIMSFVMLLVVVGVKYGLMLHNIGVLILIGIGVYTALLTVTKEVTWARGKPSINI